MLLLLLLLLLLLPTELLLWTLVLLLLLGWVIFALFACLSLLATDPPSLVEVVSSTDHKARRLLVPMPSSPPALSEAEGK